MASFPWDSLAFMPLALIQLLILPTAGHNCNSALGLTVILALALLVGVAILLVMRMVSKLNGLDTLSAFALYLMAVFLAAIPDCNSDRYFDSVLTDAVLLQLSRKKLH